MFVLVTYDVEARRTNLYRKVLGKFLGHEQNSVFFGDMTDAQHKRMRSSIQKISRLGDRLIEFVVQNRHNVTVKQLVKETENGTVSEALVTRHTMNAEVI